MKRFLIVWCLALAATIHVGEASITVPIYLEDNHAGAFYWLAQNLDLEEKCTLLHFDAHSDASAIFDSDKIRTRLRRVGSGEERAGVLREWRGAGTIQCFNWLEPLMPAPIAEVIWIPRENISSEERVRLQEEAAQFLDGQIEAAPRASGLMRSRYRVLGLEELETSAAIEGPIVASIDLDYFAGFLPKDREEAFERVWKFVAERRNLRAITIAISRPYLTSDEEANALLQLALQASLSLPTAAIQFEPFARVAHDQSLRAREFRAQKREVPGFDLESASPSLRALLLANQRRIAVREDHPRWEAALQKWADEAPTFRLAITNHQPSTDDLWRVAVDEAAAVEVAAEPWDTLFPRVQWIVQIPVYSRCNLTAARDDEIGFAQGAPPRPRWREITLPETESKLSLASLRQFFDPQTGGGAVRFRARIEASDWIRETPTMEIRRFAGSGFRAALTEQFGLPYLFGCGGLRDGDNAGAETGWGADCANFLVHALRRQGRRIPWSNPKRFRRYLEPLQESASLADAPRFTKEDAEAGVILHFGTHVAALFEDRPPLGVLNAEDIVAHQLEGPPQMLSLGELMRARGYTRFDLLRVPPPTAADDLLMGGDVMLGRSVGDQIKNGVDPFAGIRKSINGATTSVANLECVVSNKGNVAGAKKYSLRAPIEAADVLKAAGFDVIGLANNHTKDFGDEALSDSIERLCASGLSVIGAPEDRYVVRGNVAFFAINEVDRIINRPALAAALQRARAEANSIIALVHWGNENTAVVTERQRESARWLVNHGVDLIAGSHPHCLQPVDFYHGRPIIYSLGNLVFDGAPSLPSWNRGALLRVGLNARSPAFQLIPIRLNAKGLPTSEEESANGNNIPAPQAKRPTAAAR